MASLDPSILEVGQNLGASVENDFFQNFQNVSGWGLSMPRHRVCTEASEFRQWPKPRLPPLGPDLCLSEEEKQEL